MSRFRTTVFLHAATDADVVEALDERVGRLSARRVRGGDATTYVFIGDELSTAPLATHPALAWRCRRAGVSIKTMGQAQYEEHELVESAQRLHKRVPARLSAAIDTARNEGLRAGTVSNIPVTNRRVKASELPAGPASSAAPTGAMVPHLGPRIAEGFADGDDALEPDLACRVRAWPVNSLVNTAFVAAKQGDIGRALAGHIQSILGLSCDFGKSCFGGSRKYLHVHASTATQPDASTGQPMFLELYGSIVIVGEYDLRKREQALEFARERANSPGHRRYPPPSYSTGYRHD